MATFRPNEKQRVCELNFNDEFFYKIPLTEKTARNFAEICERNKVALEKLAKDDPEAFDKAYDMSLDAIDELLGEGAADDIMSLYDDPGLLEVAEVINFIASEYKAAYSAELDKMRATGEIHNRAERRGRRGNR